MKLVVWHAVDYSEVDTQEYDRPDLFDVNGRPMVPFICFTTADDDFEQMREMHHFYREMLGDIFEELTFIKIERKDLKKVHDLMADMRHNIETYKKRIEDKDDSKYCGFDYDEFRGEIDRTRIAIANVWHILELLGIETELP